MSFLKPLCFILSFFLAGRTHAVRDYCLGDTLTCLASNGLKLRDAPKGQAIGTVPLGAAVVIAEQYRAQDDRYEDIDGGWIKVRYKEQTGYVFDGYLSWLPAPAEADTSLEMYLKRHFQPVGAEIVRDNPKCAEGDGTFTVKIQNYQRPGLQLRRVVYSGWEWGHETVFFDYISLEEVFLLCRILYRDQFMVNPQTLSLHSRFTTNPENEKEVMPLNEPWANAFEVPLKTDFGFDQLEIFEFTEPDPQVAVRHSYGY